MNIFFKPAFNLVVLLSLTAISCQVPDTKEDHGTGRIAVDEVRGVSIRNRRDQNIAIIYEVEEKWLVEIVPRGEKRRIPIADQFSVCWVASGQLWSSKKLSESGHPSGLEVYRAVYSVKGTTGPNFVAYGAKFFDESFYPGLELSKATLIEKLTG